MTAPPGVSARFWDMVRAETGRRVRLLDVATGAGRVALAVAPSCARVLGIERDPALVDEARRAAGKREITNVEFLVADADVIEYADLFEDGRPPDVVVAHLFLSDAFVERAARALRPGHALAFVALHVDQWRETGRPSRFAYDEERARALVVRCGFAVEELDVEREVKTFASVEEGLAAAIGLEERWKSDGRWFRYIKFLEDGGRTLTRSHLVVKARRR
ncbi:MAG TPA: class I SAM-dependent methyltransferase [Methylomirabilota bacterium]